MRLAPALVWLTLLHACGGRLEPQNSRDSGGAGTVASIGGAATAGGTGGAASGSTAGASTGSMTATGGASASLPVVPQSEIASRQTVRFELHNSGGDVRYVVTGGGRPRTDATCSGFGVAATDGTEATALVMGIDYQCPCECPMPDPFYSEYQVVSGGDTIVVEWDARVLATWYTFSDCEYRDDPVAYRHGAWQPLEPGDYIVTFGVASLLPVGCWEDETTASCNNSPPPGSDGRCGSPDTVTVQFTLPAEGDVVAPVEL